MPSRSAWRNLLALADDVHRGHYRAQPCDGALLHELHRRLFDGVRDHAGRSRSRDFGSEWLNFGPNRSVDRARVPGRLDALFADLSKYYYERGDRQPLVDLLLRLYAAELRNR